MEEKCICGGELIEINDGINDGIFECENCLLKYDGREFWDNYF